MSDPLHIALTPRTFLRLSGPDAERYLNGQVTNDVRLVTPGTALYCAVLNPKGQLDAVCHVHGLDDGYLIDAPRDLRESLFQRLDRYIIADEVEFADESDDWYLSHLISPTPPELATQPAPVNRFGEPGYDLLSRDPTELPPSPPRDADRLEQLRIENGVPAWGAELTPGLLPAEAGLDETAISFDKGCYLGQEVVSRMKRAGKTNRHLVQLELSGEASCPAPLLVDGTEAGVVTSTARTREGRVLALGFRKRKFEKTENFDVSGPDGNPSGVTASALRRLS